MKTKETIELLEKLIAYYEEYKHLDFFDLSEKHLDCGICYVSNIVFKTDVYGVYWIRRHIQPCTAHIFMTPIRAYLDKFDVVLTLQYRIDIMKKELAHHKKWGYLARWFKPK